MSKTVEHEEDGIGEVAEVVSNLYSNKNNICYGLFRLECSFILRIKNYF